jgi:preprotein translocase subunit SecD
VEEYQLMPRNKTALLIFIILIASAATWVVLPNNPGIHILNIDRDIKIVQGLDLQGGLRVLLEAELPENTEISADQLSTARDIIEKRVNALGVTEPLIQVAGSRRILVELAGIDDPEQAVSTIKETGLLEFVQISPAELPFIQAGEDIQTDFGRSIPATVGTPEAIPPELITPTVVETEPAPTETASTTDPTSEALNTATPTSIPEATPEERFFHTILTGAELKNAGVSVDQIGSVSVVMEFSEMGQQIFDDHVLTHRGEYLGIVLDGQVISVPFIPLDYSTSGQGATSIVGDFTQEEANNLAIQLRYGALPLPLTVVENKTVGPTLGQDSLRKSTIAGLIGLGVVMAFMALYYRLPGVLADLALLIYATCTFALFKLIPVTLTLPGIAGFVLSLGVAVDANVLIFERMKEELRDGQTIRRAIDLGFSRAWPSIRDSNLSTLITCLILYWFGNTFGASIVKGFSLTLALGVMVSLFTAITVTRTFLHLVLDNIRLTEHQRWFGV